MKSRKRMPEAPHSRFIMPKGATPLAGLGTTLAVTGAFVLAGELSRCADTAAALAAYERAMRPMVKQTQGVPKIAPRLMHPRTRVGIRLLHAALRLSTWPAVVKAATRLFARPPVQPDLSRYGTA